MAGLILVVVALVLGCILASRNDDVKRSLRARQAKLALRDYADNTVLRTLAALAEDAGRLDAAAARLRETRSDADAAAAVAAWETAYGTYLMTEAFHYGPASWRDYDKRLATWPFDKVLVDHALAEMAAGRLEMTSSNLREENASSMRGFHVVRHLLTRGGRPRRAQDIGAAELDYLVAATRSLHEESVDFEASWRGTANLPAARAAVARQSRFPERAAFADEFKNPGAPGSRYASLAIPLQEVFQEVASVGEDTLAGIGALRDELAPPPGGRGYWSGDDPCADLLHRLKGAENAWLGGVEGTRGHSVSELASGYSRVMDRRVKIAFAHTAYRIAAVRDLGDAAPEERELAIRRAEAECEKLLARVAAVTAPLAMDPSVGPWAAYGR
ncbi:MAG: Imelysin [Acidobacteriota bacterium]|nr:Imelysin [Acidobacteriota bacterium]